MKTTSTLILIALLCSFGSLHAQTFTPARKVVLEVQTICSTNYGIFCPRGIVRVDSFLKAGYGSMAEIINVHSTYTGPEPMADSVYWNGCFYNANVKCNAWPQLMTDRKWVDDVDSIFYYYNKCAGDSGVADITVTPHYNAGTRALNVTATAHFAVNATGYRLALVLTEDSVHGTTPDYDQRNAYGHGDFGPLSGGGIDWAAQTDTVPAALMYYRFVARGIYPFFTGAFGSLPPTAKADSTYSYTFPTYTVPAGYNASKMRAIVLLLQASTGKIKNANGANLADSVASVQQLAKGTSSFSVYPNPFTDETSLKISLSAPEHVTLLLSDVLGQTVSMRDMGFMSSGDHLLTLSGKDLSPGVYFITVTTDHGSLTQKIVRSK